MTIPTVDVYSRGQVDSLLAGISTSASWPGTVSLDSFSGPNDDAILSAAMSYIATQTRKPKLVSGFRDYTFTGSHPLFSGFRWGGIPHMGWMNNEQSSSQLLAQRHTVNVGTGSSSFLVGGGTNLFDVQLDNLAFRSTNGVSQFMEFPTTAGGTLFASGGENLDFDGFKHVLGRPTGPLSVTLNLWRGAMTMTNAYDTQVTIGGSDNDFFRDGLNIGPISSVTGAGKYLMIASSIAKTNVGSVYFTCINSWAALNVTGSLCMGLVFTGGRFEGVNSAGATDGAVIVISGGQSVTIRDAWIAYGMTDPASAGRTSPQDAGMVMVLGGDLLLDNATYDYGAIAESVPLLYVNGGTGRISNARGAKKTGAWTGLPRSHAQPGAVLINDSSTTVV